MKAIFLHETKEELMERIAKILDDDYKAPELKIELINELLILNGRKEEKSN